MTELQREPSKSALPSRRTLLLGLAGLALVSAMAFDTKVVQIGSDSDQRQQAFDADVFGEGEFPRIREIVMQRAAEAGVLAEALASDKSAAIERHGRMSGAFPALAVGFTAKVGEGGSGVVEVDVDGMPEGTSIRVQTGPAINGTELRDIPGDIAFGQFTNQIEFQDAGAGINRAMSAAVLDGLDREALTGRTVSATGVFTLINPASWLVTPVEFEVEP